VPFESPRFAGDSLLEEILADPDTGTRKLKKGSPAASVLPVQLALWELWWPEKAEPPIVTSADAFADGDYGPGTERTVLQYKKRYDLRFPPGAPGGIFDGFAGPRTLASLDRHCVLFDDLELAINAKFAELSAGAAVVESSRSAPVEDTMGISRVISVNALSFHIYARRGGGAFSVGDPIASAYVFAFGGPTGRYGWPVSDAVDEGNGDVRQDFEFGALRFSPATGSADPVGAVPPPPPNAPIPPPQGTF
jgi:hypothetical protein